MRTNNYYLQTTNVNKDPKSSRSIRTLLLASKLIVFTAILLGWNMSAFAQTTFAVPNIGGVSGCSGVIVNMTGGSGGSGGAGGNGGYGGSVVCTLNVALPTVITSLTYYVGSAGSNGFEVPSGIGAGAPGGAGYGTGGSSGGFAGPSTGGSYSGGGGGGSSAVFNTTGSVLLYVAGGGGGGAAGEFDSYAGGNAGSNGGTGQGVSPDFGGSGGTSGSFGATGGLGSGNNGGAAAGAAPGNGGTGGEAPANGHSGGGGGAGYGGGGGGGSDAATGPASAGGGGGANYVNLVAITTTGLTNGTATATGNGAVTLTLYPAAPGTTSGTAVCVGSTIPFTDATPGGTWSTSAAGIASISGTTGPISVIGISAGTANITYSVGGYYYFVTVTVNALPTISSNPTNTSVCDGSNTSFSTTATGGGLTYQWQVNTGSGFTNIINGGVYSNATTNTLNITGATIAMNGYQYQCVVTGTCSATTTAATLTVNPLPSAITGPATVCRGQTISLTDAPGAGTWSSSNNANATVGSASGVVTGAGNANGASTTVTITYTSPAGCNATTNITVNPLSPITGAQNVCAYGATITLHDATFGGTWSSIGAPVTAGGGGGETLTPQAAGPVTVSYIMPTGCTSTATLTVNPLPDPIIGAAPVCVGSTITLSDQTSGGTWSSSNNGEATVGTSSGVVTGVNAGTPDIIYSLPTGCASTQTVLVNPLPTISTNNVCVGSSVSLTHSPLTYNGGTWTSSNISVATINYHSYEGNIHGVSAGVDTITYTLNTGCIATTTVQVNPLPGPITGTTTFCQGSTTTLSDTTSGGLWSSASVGIAMVGSATGIVSSGPGTGGTTNIIYTLPTGCTATTAVTVYELGTISGNTSVCIGSTTTLSDAPSGGTWSSSDANATIDMNSGVVTGVNAGTTTITYTTLQGCTATITETVDSLPTLTGGSVCIGSEVALAHSPRFGTWSSSNNLIATINPHSFDGNVHGVAAGLDTITYTLNTTGCANTATVMVNPIYPIAGATAVCSGNTITLSDQATGGTWSSNNTAVASVDPVTGIVTGESVLTASTATITYTTPAGCTATTNITVNPLPASITGTFYVCQGLTTDLFDGTPGGTWSSAIPTIATVTPGPGAGGGIVTGVTPGNVQITYELTTGCSATATVTVNPIGTISGIPNTCIGTTTTLSETVTGGGWVTAATSVGIAQVGPLSGIVQGISDGVATIDYVVTATGCVATYSVTVGALPAISGPSAVCVGSSITLSDIVSGGTWSSSNTDASVVPSTGVVTGEAAGTPNITYTLVPGCFATDGITVNALPTLSGGSVCAGSTIEITHAPNGGTWTNHDPSVATLAAFFFNPNIERATGVSAGIDTITYTLSTGCAATTTVIVNPLPGPITGDLVVCPGISTTLSDSTLGGVWSSSNNARATVGSATGIVTGVAAGGFGTRIIYTLPATGCDVSVAFTVTNTLNAITGGTKVCMGQSITLNDVATGGTWTSMDPAVGAVGATSGVVTGISAGTTIVTYSLGTGCSAIHSVAVDALSPIIGTPSVCVGATTSLSDTTFGGTWSSSNASVATVNVSTGLVTGVNGGASGNVAVISYSLPTGCITTISVTVNPLPTAIAGIGTGVCFGMTTTLSDGIAGGTWSSSNTSIAVIDPNSGFVTTVDTGTVVITYSLPTGCTAATASLTVNPLPLLISSLTPPAICNNSVFSYVPASDLGGTTFNWNRNPISGLSNSGNVGLNNPLETLNDTTVNPVSVPYIYTLYTTATGCVSTSTVVVVVNPSPMLTSSLTPPAVCDSSLFTYISTSATASVTYTWHRDTVIGISNSPASGVGDSIGEYLVNITTNPIVVTYMDTLWYAGCDNVQLVRVTVNPKPMLSSPLTNPAICDSTLFTYVPASHTAGATFSWSRATILGISNPAASGIGTIHETLDNLSPNPIVVTYVDTIMANGCSNTENVTVTVNPNPMLSSPLNPAAICDSTVFNYPPTSLTIGATFSWVRPYVAGIGLLAGSGTGNPNEVLVNTTNIDVTVNYIYTITANGCSNTQIVSVVVHPQPLLSSDPGPFTVCSGATFSYAPTGYVLGTNFAWTRAVVPGISPTTGAGTGNIVEILTDSTLTPKTVTYVIVMTANGCSNSTSISLTVDPSAGVPALTTYPPNALCLNTMFQNFGVAAPAPAGVQYIWTASNATVWATGQPNQYALISFDSAAGPSVITVKSNVTGINCISTQTYNVTVGSTMSNDPQVIYSDGQLMCLENLSVETTYHWGFDDAITLDSTIIPGETNQTYFINSPDFTYRNYWVITTQPDGCMQKTYYNVPTGVSNINADITEVKIYPNPANDVVNVDINTSVAGNLEVEVLDVLGQKINMVPAINHKAQINVASLPSGVYLIDCYRDGVKINSARFVKN